MQWGAWGGGGMAVQVAGFMERMKRMGLGVLPPPQGLAALARALKMAWSPCLTQGPPITVGAPLLRALGRQCCVWLSHYICAR